MRHRIARIGVLQTATMFGILYAVLGLFFLPFIYAMMRFAPMLPEAGFPFGGRFLLLMPVLYGAMGFVFTACAALIYNLVAGWIGGIEIDLTVVADSGAGA